MIPKDCLRLAEVDSPIAGVSKRSTEVGPYHTVPQVGDGLR
jgi:hypothetical protein